MKKFFSVLIVMLVFGVASAHGFGVSAIWNPQTQVSSVAGEFVFQDSVLLGGVVSLDDFAADLSVGFIEEAWSPEGGVFYIVGRAALPVFDGSSFVVGDPYVNAGVMLVIDSESDASISAEVGFTSQVNDFSIREVPDIYARVGLVF